MGRRLKDQPVESGTVRDMTLDGRGVVDTAAKTVFVDGALAGEEIRFRRQRKQRNFDDAELLEVVTRSADRAEPVCANFGTCGGCSLQHLSGTAQLALKHASLLQALQRIGDVQPETILEPLAGRPFGYRRRARLGARLVPKKERVLVGFRERRSSYVADMTSCETLKPELSALIPGLSALIGAMRLARQVPQVEISMGDTAICLIFRVLETPGDADRKLLRDFAEQNGVHVWLQTGGPATLAPLDEDSAPLDLSYALPAYDLRLAFGPLDFIQVNQDMNRLMVDQAMQLANPQADERVLDLFCGIGNFTLPLARHAGSVVGVEIDPAMVAKARANAAGNDLNNVEFHAADLADADARYEWWGDGFDLVVVDPPRAGAQEVLAQIAKTGASKILYVSCHPGSLARDAGILVAEYGYRLRAAGAMDMFPQTSHVEAMALFERAG